MKTQELHEVLAALHEELNRAETVDHESRRLLQELMTDISKLLAVADEAEPAERPAGLTERLAEISKEFEDHHPALVSAIGRLADALSRIGV
jgi:class 3 adenylate cyclase